ncbi:hypothetical protein EO238_30290, partial [Citrobacter sp. AAK_AS5]
MEAGKENPFRIITTQPIKKDYDLSEETAIDFEYDLMEALGRRLGSSRFDYQRKGDVIIRVKDHEPNWSNFNEDVED